MESEATLVPKFVEFTQKMVQSLFNYTASYAVESNEMKPSETVRLYIVYFKMCATISSLDPTQNLKFRITKFLINLASLIFVVFSSFDWLKAILIKFV